MDVRERVYTTHCENILAVRASVGVCLSEMDDTILYATMHNLIEMSVLILTNEIH